MIRADRPTAVRRWVRRPLWWGAVVVLLAGALFASDITTARSDERIYGNGHRVTGEVAHGWDGGNELEVTYRHPVTGRTVRADTYVWDASLLPDRTGPVALEVSRSDPEDVAVAGDRFPATVNLAGYAPWTLPPFLVWAIRRRTVRQTERLIASDAVAYRMVATASPPTPWWGRRWRLHLHPIDAGPASPPVCTVPLIAAPAQAGSFVVEVKGSPRPYARVVARGIGGDVLWPSGRALRSGGEPRLADEASIARVQKVARGLLVLGFALIVFAVASFSFGTYAEDVRERQRELTATVTRTSSRPDGRVDVNVRYTWSGRQYLGTVTEDDVPGEGESLTVRVDPVSPTRVWSTTEDDPPRTHDGDVGALAMLLSFAVFAAAAIAKSWVRNVAPGSYHPEVAWRGLALSGGRLWHGRVSRFYRRPRLRFEPDALVLVDADGRVTSYRWDDHVDAEAAAGLAVPWRLLGFAPGGYSTATLWIHIGREAAGHRVSRRLAGTGFGTVLWEELPALASYLAVTPRAREGLADPYRIAALIDALAAPAGRRPAGSWPFDVLLPGDA